MYSYKNNINRFINKIFIGCINFYQKIISPIIPARCRYYPTCSNYGKQAIAWHGVRSGGWLLVKRLGRCQPWGGHGIDFVPLPLDRYHYRPAVSNESLSVYRDSTSYVARLNNLLSQK